MSDERRRVPSLFWLNDAGSGLPMSIVESGQRAMCFFSLELMAFEYAECYLGGEPGVRSGTRWAPRTQETSTG